MTTTEEHAAALEQRHQEAIRETTGLYAVALKLKEDFEKSGEGLDSEAWAKVEAAFEDWEKAGDREMEIKADANRAAKISGITSRRSAPPTFGSSPDGKGPALVQKYDGPQTLGKLFAASEEFRGWFARVAPGGQIPDGVQVAGSPPVSVPQLLDYVRAPGSVLLTGASDTSAGAFVRTEDSGIYVPLGRRPISILDIISIRTTGSDTVDYVAQTARTDSAAIVDEATDIATGGLKPQSNFTFEVRTANVRTIAHWVAASRRALSDAGQLRGIIDDELRAGLLEELEDQIVTGDGTGSNFVGLDAVSGTQDQAWSTNILETTRKARTLVRTVGRDIPTAYVFNPTDWQTIDLLQDNEARYFFGGPREIMTPRLWGLPVVECEAQPAGNGWVGNWMRAVLWNREAANILVSDSHSDFFIRNLIAILAEMRAAFAVTKPVAFVEIDLTA